MDTNTKKRRRHPIASQTRHFPSKEGKRKGEKSSGQRPPPLPLRSKRASAAQSMKEGIREREEVEPIEKCIINTK